MTRNRSVRFSSFFQKPTIFERHATAISHSSTTGVVSASRHPLHIQENHHAVGTTTGMMKGSSKSRQRRGSRTTTSSVATKCFVRGFFLAAILGGIVRLCFNHRLLKEGQQDTMLELGNLLAVSFKSSSASSASLSSSSATTSQDEGSRRKQDQFGACIMFKDDLLLLRKLFSHTKKNQRCCADFSLARFPTI